MAGHEEMLSFQNRITWPILRINNFKLHQTSSILMQMGTYFLSEEQIRLTFGVQFSFFLKT